jgi:hypothetical protein
MRADSGFWSAKTIRACRCHGIRYSITVRQTRPIRAAIATIDGQAWVDIVYPDGGLAQVAETRYRVTGSSCAAPAWSAPRPSCSRTGATTPWSPTGSAPRWGWTRISAGTRWGRCASVTSRAAPGCGTARRASSTPTPPGWWRPRWRTACCAGSPPSAGRPSGAGGGHDAAPDPAGPARPADPLRQTMEVASAGRLAVGGVVRADTGPAALCGVRHLTHAAAERTPPDPFGSA